jgi:hypothetical protein
MQFNELIENRDQTIMNQTRGAAYWKNNPDKILKNSFNAFEGVPLGGKFNESVGGYEDAPGTKSSSADINPKNINVEYKETSKVEPYSKGVGSLLNSALPSGGLPPLPPIEKAAEPLLPTSRIPNPPAPVAPVSQAPAPVAPAPVPAPVPIVPRVEGFSNINQNKKNYLNLRSRMNSTKSQFSTKEKVVPYPMFRPAEKPVPYPMAGMGKTEFFGERLQKINPFPAIGNFFTTILIILVLVVIIIVLFKFF